MLLDIASGIGPRLTFVDSKASFFSGQASISLDISDLDIAFQDLILLLVRSSVNETTMNPSGYTLIGDIFANSTDDTGLRCYYRVAQSPVPTSISISGMSVAGSRGWVVQVWRGASLADPIESSVFESSVTSGIPVCPDATTVIPGAAVVWVGARNGGFRQPTNPDLQGVNGNSAGIAAGYRAIPYAGIATAPDWSVDIADSTAYSSASAAIVINPE